MAEEKTELLGIDKETFLQALTEFPIVEEEVYKVHKIRDLRLRHISFLGYILYIYYIDHLRTICLFV